MVLLEVYERALAELTSWTDDATSALVTELRALEASAAVELYSQFDLVEIDAARRVAGRAAADPAARR